MGKLYSIFVGNHLDFVLKDLQATDNDGNMSNMVLRGILLEEDDTYYYIGNNRGEIHTALKKEDVTFIMSNDAAQEEDFDFEVPKGSSVN